MEQPNSTMTPDRIESIVDSVKHGSNTSRRSFLTKAAATGGAVLALSVGASNSALASDVSNDDVSDVDVLNYALTLEHLEDQYYKMGVERFDERDYRRAKVLQGFSSRVRGDVAENFEDISAHEATHVETLTAVIKDLGGDPVSAANYDFGVDDVDEFIAIAGVLENTGVSAYDGAIHLIERPGLLTAGATIATVEARHASYLNLLNGQDPFPAAFDDPKTMQEILDAAGQFFAD